MNRRRFLALLGSTAVAPALPAIPVPSPVFVGMDFGAVTGIAIMLKAQGGLRYVGPGAMSLADVQRVVKRLREIAVPLPENGYI